MSVKYDLRHAMPGNDGLLARCAFCKKIMPIAEGSIIFGNKWYHQDCFNTPRDVPKLTIPFEKKVVDKNDT
jgi:hypothetical protein